MFGNVRKFITVVPLQISWLNSSLRVSITTVYGRAKPSAKEASVFLLCLL